MHHAIVDLPEISEPARFQRIRNNKVFFHRSRLGHYFIATSVILSLLSPPLFNTGSIGWVACLSLGWVCFIAGVLLRFWATLYIGGHKTHELVVEGPFSLCRNPLYLGAFLIAAGMALFMQSPTVLAGAALMIWLYTRITVRFEERRLESIHGQVYRAYVEQTPRYLPRLAAYHSASVVHVDVKMLRKELRRSAVYLCLPPIFQILAYLHAAPWWPHPLFFP